MTYFGPEWSEWLGKSVRRRKRERESSFPGSKVVWKDGEIELSISAKTGIFASFAML